MPRITSARLFLGLLVLVAVGQVLMDVFAGRSLEIHFGADGPTLRADHPHPVHNLVLVAILIVPAFMAWLFKSEQGES